MHLETFRSPSRRKGNGRIFSEFGLSGLWWFGRKVWTNCFRFCFLSSRTKEIVQWLKCLHCKQLTPALSLRTAYGLWESPGVSLEHRTRSDAIRCACTPWNSTFVNVFLTKNKFHWLCTTIYWRWFCFCWSDLKMLYGQNYPTHVPLQNISLIWLACH